MSAGKPTIKYSRPRGWLLHHGGIYRLCTSWQNAVDTLVDIDTRHPTRVHTPSCESRKGAGVSCNCWASEAA